MTEPDFQVSKTQFLALENGEKYWKWVYLIFPDWNSISKPKNNSGYGRKILESIKNLKFTTVWYQSRLF